MAGRLAGKVVIITGGARGQGAVEGELFASEGAEVVLTDVLEDEGRAAAAAIGCGFMVQDVSLAEDWQRVVDDVDGRFGRIDVLVNNAAIFQRRKLADTTPEDFERLFAINVRGVFLGMKTAAPVMQRAGSGSIINISSLAGLVAAPGAFAYGASKWAVRGMTKTAAVELAKYGVRCNSIHPGMIETDMLDQVTLGDDGRRQRMLASVPLGRVAEPLDIARMALFLASDDSRYATGAEFVVDGGSHAL